MAKKDESINCHWMFINLQEHGNHLKGISKYDQAFLEELDVNSIKNTDLQLAAIVDYAQERKLPYKIVVSKKGMTEIKEVYNPNKIK